MKKIASILLWLLCATHLHGQGFIKAEYFIDTDPGLNNGTAIPLSTSSDTAVFTASITIGALSTGFHTVSIRMLHNDGTWGLFETRQFYVTPPLSADAANFAAAEYFINSDPGVGNGTALAITTGGSTVNFTAAITTSLAPGFHTLAIRTKDLDGKWGLFEARLFYITQPLAADVADITAAEYFIDTDPGVGNANALSVGASGAVVNFSASVTASLAIGFHALSIRTQDLNGKWGLFETRLFYITPPLVADVADITAAEYFIDTDPGVGNANALSVGASGAVVNFSASVTASLAAGFHALSIRTKDLNGKWGFFETRLFYITPPLAADMTDITAAEYFIDADPGLGNGTPVSVGANGAVVNFSASVTASLSTGFHTLSIRTKDLNGKWGLFETRLFYITQPSADMPVITAAEFFFDIDPGVGNANPLAIPASGDVVAYAASAVVPCLAPGTHYMCIRMKDQNNQWGLFQHDTLTVQSGVSAANVTPAGPVTICATGSVTLSAPVAAGITYQWLNNSSPIAGATSASYTATAAGNYSLKTTCSSSFATSNVVVVNTIPVDTFYADADSDGFGDLASPTYVCFQPAGTVTNADDCNDGNNAIHPNATEICNGLDDDCDGLTDDADPTVTGRPTWYADTDADGFGNPSATVLACVQPSGYVANNTDCNDGNFNVNPSAQEICNNMDDDCDGLTDDADPSATGQSTWYADADGDGYGNAAITVFLCASPSGYVGNDDDCNDGNNAIHPNAAETCNSIDDDCDGLIDNADPSVSGRPVWYADTDNDSYGNPNASLLSCTQPSGYVSNNNDCNDSSNAVNPVATEVCNGYDDDCDGLIDVTDPSLVDNEAPVITCSNDTVVANVPGQCGANVVYAQPTATDNCAIASIVQTVGQASGVFFSAGTTTNTFVATDELGNTATCSFTVTVIDNEVPVISGCPSNVVTSANLASCDKEVFWTAPQASDNCSIQSLISNYSSGYAFPLGTTTVVYTATDVGGNTATCTFTVMVNDNTSPVITDCPANITTNPNAGNCTKSVTWTAPSATDNCSMQSLTSDYASGHVFAIGTTTVTYIATDIYGSTSTCSFTVTVNPNTEVCNGIDDDCDNQVDEGLTLYTYYADTDGDGYGNASSSIITCVTPSPSGYSSNNTDCNDNNISIHATQSFYVDTDQDGYGSTTTAMLCALTPPLGYSTNNTDCNDGNQNVHPGVTENCENNIDDNCNGQINEGCCAITVNAGSDESTFFGYTGDQQVTHTATVTGGTAPYSYNWTIGRALKCNEITSAGDEIFSAGTGGSCANTICPTSGTLTNNATCSGSATVTVRLMDTTNVCVTVTDANNCTATDCFTVYAMDVRCFSGNSNNYKVYVCHYTGSSTNPYVEICVPNEAVSAHLANNSQDYVGHCASRLDNGASSGAMEMFVYPNPAQTQVTVEFDSPSDAAYQLSVFDITGRVVLSNNGSAMEGGNDVVLPINGLALGVYNLRLTIGDESSSVRLVVTK